MSMVKLGDVVFRAKEFVDKDNTSLQYYIGGEHFEYGQVCITKKGEIEGSTIGPAFHMKFLPGDVLLMSRNPHLRKAGVVDFEGICSDVSYVCRTRDEEVLLQRYLPFIFQTDDFWNYAEEHKHGSTNFFLNWKDFETYEFELPEIEQQRELTALLWAAQDTKQSYIRLIEQTDALVKSQFIELTKSAKVQKLNEVCLSFGRGKAPKYVECSDVYTINQACIYWNELRLENVKFQNPDYFKSENALKDGTVLMNSTGTGTLGRTSVFINPDGKKYMADSHVTVMVPDTSIVLPRFLQCFFANDNTQTELYRTCVNGSTSQTELSREALGRMEIPTPSIAEQEAFIRIAEQSDKSKYYERKTRMIQLVRSIQEVQNNAK